MSIDGSTTYSNYKNHILQSGATTVTINSHKNKCWFHFSRDFLFPLIKERYALLYDYQTLGIGSG